jgi:chromosome segregation ATPase
MISGRQTLGSIDQALQGVRSQIRGLDEEIQGTSARLLQLSQEESEQYRALARIRVDQMVAGEMLESLDRAEKRVDELLRARQETLQSLLERIDEAHQRQASLEAERMEQAKTVDAAEEVVDAAEEKVQQALAKDSAYQGQLTRAQETDRIAKHAEMKAELAEQDRADKGKPYEADRLFMYLWTRGYGTSRYKANPLARMLDGWVARLCRFQGARANYAMLLEIPKRLHEYADQVRKEADAQFEALRALEQAAAKGGEVASLQRVVDDARSKLEAIDGDIEKLEQRFQSLLLERAVFAAGEDEQCRQAVELMSGEFKNATLVSLRREAQLTSTPDDDVIIEKLAEIEGAAMHLEDAVEQYQRTLRSHQQRLDELESIRREFKRHRYDGAHSGFADSALLTMMLNEFLNGVLSGDKLWRTIERQQRTRRIRADPTFGSGGFGRSGGVQHSGGLGGGVFGSGRRGGFGGGGFRTGGGFGGGGDFRTGGGF